MKHAIVPVVCLLILLGAAAARATDISGTISTTLTITENSRLTGDVTCTVTNAPCIKFGASDIKLELNGHVMTGNANPASCVLAGERGISTDTFDRVSIEGPGLLTKFRGVGIFVGSTVGTTVFGNHNRVKGVSITETCDIGIVLLGSDHVVEDNSLVRVGVDFGLLATGSGHRIRRNEVIRSGGHGIGAAGLSGAEIKENNLSGNSLDGILLFSTGGGATGNTIEGNEILGNFVDIGDANAAGANDWRNNLCQTSSGPGAPTCPNVPNFAGHMNAGS